MNNWQILFLMAAVVFGVMGFVQLRGPNISRADVARYFVAAVIAMLFVALTACATPNAVVETKIVKEEIPVATSPIKPSDIPPAPPALGPRPPTAQQAADVAAAGHCRDVAWIIQVFPLLRVSAGLPPEQAPDYPECDRH